jgi:hypothetical protein
MRAYCTAKPIGSWQSETFAISPVSDEFMQQFVSHIFSTYSSYAIVTERQCQASLFTYLISTRIPPWKRFRLDFDQRQVAESQMSIRLEAKNAGFRVAFGPK